MGLNPKFGGNKSSEEFKLRASVFVVGTILLTYLVTNCSVTCFVKLSKSYIFQLQTKERTKKGYYIQELYCLVWVATSNY